jgi:hypothetical protein
MYMNRGAFSPQNDSSSDWQLNKLKELRRLLRENQSWPETGDQLISDLSHLTTTPKTASPNEDYEMLSIVVNDALIGIDVMKKYPAFYARMLADEELRIAFLDTLELLEEGLAGNLPDYSGSEFFNLDFLQEFMPRPAIKKSTKNNWQLIWQRTVHQLQILFNMALLQPTEDFRSGGVFLDEDHINILNSHMEIEEKEVEVRLDLLRTTNQLGNLNLMLTCFAPKEPSQRFEATIVWGDYCHTSAVNSRGLAKFPPLDAAQLFSPSGKVKHDFELRLELVD